MNAREGVGSSFRISGKPNIKRPLVLLGNNIQIDFTSSGHAKYFFLIFFFYNIFLIC